MTLDEAMWIAHLSGKAYPISEPSQSIYSCLVGDVFNRYWSSGLSHAEIGREHILKYPKIERPLKQ